MIRRQTTKKPPHWQRRPYVATAVAEKFSEEKPLPEETWRSLKRAVGIEGKYVPPGGGR